jgi:ubiquinone biosynthesis accessory factor UbiJ
MPIKALLLSALETSLNHYLALDPDVATKLAPLTGKVIAVTIQPFNETIYLCPGDNSIQCLDYFDHPDTFISGSLSALGLMGLSATPMRAIFSGKVSIEGDVHVGRKLQALLAQLDINLEAQLAKFLGDEISGRIGTVFRSFKSWSDDSLNSLKLNTSELLQEETRDLPAPEEANIFYRQVDTLRNDFDRLQARIQLLQQTLDEKNQSNSPSDVQSSVINPQIHHNK